jgi:hypothetical protein
MTGPKAFVLGCTILAIAILVGSFANPATSQGRGGYMVASDGKAFVWRVNTSTGEISYCARNNDSISESYVKQTTPYCSNQTPAVQ